MGFVTVQTSLGQAPHPAAADTLVSSTQRSGKPLKKASAGPTWSVAEDPRESLEQACIRGSGSSYQVHTRLDAKDPRKLQ